MPFIDSVRESIPGKEPVGTIAPSVAETSASLETRLPHEGQAAVPPNTKPQASHSCIILPVAGDPFHATVDKIQRAQHALTMARPLTRSTTNLVQVRGHAYSMS